MIRKIRKRDGKIVDFNPIKITNAIWKAAQAVGGKDHRKAAELTDNVMEFLDKEIKRGEIPTVEQVQDIVEKVLIEEDANTPFIVGPLQTGKFRCLLVAPATANTVAKIVHGIADTIITNAVSQTNKSNTPIYILPVDRQKGKTKTILPGGESFELCMRDVDVHNTDILKGMRGIGVLNSPFEIKNILAEVVKKK